MSAGTDKKRAQSIAVLIDFISMYKNAANYLFKMFTQLFLKCETSFFLNDAWLFFAVEDFPRFSYSNDFTIL